MPLSLVREAVVQIVQTPDDKVGKLLYDPRSTRAGRLITRMAVLGKDALDISDEDKLDTGGDKLDASELGDTKTAELRSVNVKLRDESGPSSRAADVLAALAIDASEYPDHEPVAVSLVTLDADEAIKQEQVVIDIRR